MNKILLISHDLSVSGAPNSLLRHAKYLRQAGFEVDIWSIQGGNLISSYKKAGFSPLIIKNTSYYGFIKFWNKNKQDYDLIVCNTTNTYKCVDILQHYKIPLIWFIRETNLVDDNMANNRDFARVLTNFYNIYTVSEYSASIINKYNSHVKVIHNAVEDYFKNFSPIGDGLRCGYIGSIIKHKGVENLLEAFSKASEQNDKISLTIAGKNSSYANGLVLKYKNIKQINWLGEVQGKDKQSFFDNIDVLFVPSVDEAFGLTVAEGCMLGKIVVTTTSVGANYLIEDKKSGIILSSNDSELLASSINFLASKNSNDLIKMQKLARQRYLQYGTTDKEKSEVLAMFYDNAKNFPVEKYPLKLRIFEASTSNYGKHTKYYLFGHHLFSIPKKIYHKEISCNGKIRIFLFGKRIFSYKHIYRINASQLKTCKYVHIMNNDKFNKPFVDFLNRNFDPSEHMVLFRKGHDFPVPQGNNVIQFYDFAQLNLDYPNIKKIIFHSLIGGSIEFLYKHKKLLSKSYWMIWGGDLYNAPRDKVNDFVRANFKGYISDTDGDCDVAKKKYSSNPECYNAGYTFPITKEMIENAKRIDHDYIQIQINNSADDSTLEMLDVLSKFKNENIKIRTILSYGKVEYKDEIVTKGKQIFGDKFEYLDKLISPAEYAKWVAQNDILILNQNRQQGLGNSFVALALGVKLFIRAEITTYNHFNSKGIKVFDTNKIKDMKLSELADYPNDIKINNQKKSQMFFEDSYLRKLWSKVFNKGDK